MSNRLHQLRDAVVNRGREVEVTPSGEVREAKRGPEAKDESQRGTSDKATKLAPRTFGAR